MTPSRLRSMADLTVIPVLAEALYDASMRLEREEAALFWERLGQEAWEGTREENADRWAYLAIV